MAIRGRYYGIPARRCPSCGESFYPKFEWARLCFPCWKASKGSAPAAPPSDLPSTAEWREMLPLLIRLCHPDKHQNSTLSNRVTQWLLGKREDL